MIDLKVAGDHEIFGSPSDFTAEVTGDALRHFETIGIEVATEALEVTLHLERHGADWSPTGTRDVKLRVSGRDQVTTQDAFRTVGSAVSRGGTEKTNRRQLIAGIVAQGALLVVTTAALVSALYLLKLEVDFVWVLVAALIVGGILEMYFGSWLYPSIEIAREGQTHLWRTSKLLGAVAVPLVLAGITKFVFERPG